MATTRADIAEWFDRGVRQGSTHMIVVCDTFDYEDYPVFVAKTENVREAIAAYDGPNMQRVMEVYKLSMDKEVQLNEPRSHNI